MVVVVYSVVSSPAPGVTGELESGRHQLEEDKVIWLSRQLTALAVAHVQLGNSNTWHAGTLALWHSNTVTKKKK